MPEECKDTCSVCGGDREYRLKTIVPKNDVTASNQALSFNIDGLSSTYQVTYAQFTTNCPSTTCGASQLPFLDGHNADLFLAVSFCDNPGSGLQPIPWETDPKHPGNLANESTDTLEISVIPKGMRLAIVFRSEPHASVFFVNPHRDLTQKTAPWRAGPYRKWSFSDEFLQNIVMPSTKANLVGLRQSEARVIQSILIFETDDHRILSMACDDPYVTPEEVELSSVTLGQPRTMTVLRNWAAEKGLLPQST